MSGPSYVRVSAPAGWHLKRILHDGQDVTDAPLAFEPGSQLSGLRVVLTQSAASVSGSVRDDRGAAVLDATVVVFPDDETLWRPQSRFIRTARPDTSGRFEMTGLPAPRATASWRCRRSRTARPRTPSSSRSIRDRAERLALAEGEAKTMELRLRP